MMTQEIGVVVIGRNEGERLIASLTSIKPRTSNIVYVDSGSVDGSVKEAEGFGAFVVVLDLTKPFTAARARNAGFFALVRRWPQIRFVQFIDGDCLLAEDWLEIASDFIEQRNEIAIVCGRRRERYPGESVYNKLADLEWDTPIGETATCGGDALVRVQAFEAVGGFCSRLIAGEEPELCVRLREMGWKIWRLDAEMTQHDMAMTRFRQWWIRSVRSGYGTAEVWLLHYKSPSGIWGREVARGIFWGGALPAVIVVGGFFYPALLCAALAYPLQFIRVAFKQGAAKPESWIYSFFTAISKFASFQGTLRLAWHTLHGGKIRLIEYK
jgi:glycosyltransferase involved in cell wall biosynthesis